MKNTVKKGTVKKGTVKKSTVKKGENNTPHNLQGILQSGGLSFIELLQSTLWAALGVQREENRLRDFSKGNPWHFILMGIGFTVIFVGGLIAIVQWVLAT